MGFALLAYSDTTGGSVTDHDMVAAVDSDFSQRNSHYIFTEKYRLMAACYLGASVTRVNVQVPTWNAISRFNLWPLNKSADVPSPPQVCWFRDMMPDIPTNEEFTVKNTSAASEVDDLFLWLATTDWSANIPPGKLVIPVRVTATITIVAHAWSALGALTFEQSLRGGTYAVVGAEFQGTHMTAFRVVFPKYKLYGGRKLRPGWIAQNAVGDLEEASMQINPYRLGEWGRFFTFEPPQLEIWGNTAGSTTIEGRLWLVFLGEQDQT